jgi:hypothetical protein
VSAAVGGGQKFKNTEGPGNKDKRSVEKLHGGPGSRGFSPRETVRVGTCGF